MAGFFGLFDYEKEGPGISKNAPKKKTFIVFFETFFRNFWKFININLVYLIVSLPVITNGLAAAGITNVTRNIARDKHSFGISDFFETIKKNWKQALPVGIINTLIYIILGFDIYFFYYASEGVMATVGLAVALCMTFIFTVMQFYIWTLIITFKFTLKQLYKNSFKFVFINMKMNLLCFFSVLLIYAVNIAVLFLLKSRFFPVLLLELFLYVILFPSFRYLLVQYCVFPSITKYIIDPYYAEHPDDDIEKRKNLGIEIEKKTEPKVDGEEEEPENVFED